MNEFKMNAQFSILGLNMKAFCLGTCEFWTIHWIQIIELLMISFRFHYRNLVIHRLMLHCQKKLN